MKALIGILITGIVLVFAASAQAAPRPTTFWQIDGTKERNNYVEQQTVDASNLIINPTPCIWDVDDYDIWQGSGDLAAGSTVSKSDCMIADGNDNVAQDDHPVFVTVTSRASDLTVRLTNSVGYSTVGTVVLAGHYWSYTFCHVDRTPGPYPIIDGSNGGTGVRVDYTLSITAGARTARDTSAVFQLGVSNPATQGCTT